MKYSILFLVIFLGVISCEDKKAKVALGELLSEDEVFINDISIQSYTVTNYLIDFGKSKPVISEEYGFDVAVYHSDKNSFEFTGKADAIANPNTEEGTLISFRIVRPDVIIKIKNLGIKVGDDISILKPTFVKSYNESIIDHVVRLEFGLIKNELLQMFEDGIHVTYDPLTNKILEIELFYSV